MTEIPTYIAEGTAAATSVPIDVIGRASPEIFTTTTADPGTGGTTLAVTLRDRFPQSGSFLIRIDAEEMLVTGGQGTGAGSFTVTRAQNGTTATAHTSGVVVSQVVGVQRVEPIYAKKQVTYKGRGASFQIPGRAGTAGQKLMSIFNAAGSNVIVDVATVLLDLNSTAAKTVQGPAIRLYKVTAAPTNGAAVTKMAEDSTLTSNTNVTLLQDASSDNTGATTALTSTLTAGQVWTQTYPSQLYTVVGFAPFDTHRFLPGEEEFITLNAGEGMVTMLDYTVATANPTTERWVVDIRWLEYSNA